jgi:hypothetical protein
MAEDPRRDTADERHEPRDQSNARRDRLNEDGRAEAEREQREQDERGAGRDRAPLNSGRPKGAPWLGGG